jgi:hypothetical protein
MDKLDQADWSNDNTVNFYIEGADIGYKVKLSPEQAVEACRVVRC